MKGPVSLKLGRSAAPSSAMRRLNRLPVFLALGLVVLFLAVIFYGLTLRSLGQSAGDMANEKNLRPAWSDADRLKDGIPDGIIGDPAPVAPHPSPDPPRPALNPFPTPQAQPSFEPGERRLEPDEVWRARLEREQGEQMLRELHRQRMASLQADNAALDAPIAVSLGALGQASMASDRPDLFTRQNDNEVDSLYATIASQNLQLARPGDQAAKQRFLNQSVAAPGYLEASVVPQFSAYELKRGSVIPATLITGINSDLPGRIIAQVSHDVFDSVTGRHLLIPQGARLFGRYDAEVAFGQERVLVVWSDIVFPNGSTLQLGSMPGVDAAGRAGFSDKVDHHHLRTFGSAVLTALIGAGTEMLLQKDQSIPRAPGEILGQASELTISRNLNVQPTIEIRPGFVFNVLVEYDFRLNLYTSNP